MKISARNQLKGTVSAIAEGAVNGVVSIDLGSTVVKADITMEAINDLGLKEGTDAMAIIKASNVMFAAGSERIQGISARNQIAGTIASVKKGAVNGHVTIETPEGSTHHGLHHERGHRGSGSRRGCCRARHREVHRRHRGRGVTASIASASDARTRQGRVLHAALLHFRIPFPVPRFARRSLFLPVLGHGAAFAGFEAARTPPAKRIRSNELFRLPQNNLTL